MKENEDGYHIAKVLSGHTASFAFLVNKYQNLAYTIALRLLKNPQEAEDAAQEGFIKAYRLLEGFEQKSKFSTWLYTIVYRVAITKLQKQKRDAWETMDDNLSEAWLEDGDPTPFHQLVDADRQTAVRNAIASLPATESLLITLFYVNDHSVTEIHAITGLTEANIKVKLFRARKMLEGQLRYLL